MQQFKVQLVSSLRVSLVPVAIDPGASFGDKMGVVTMKKPGNPAFGNLTFRYRTRKISYHLSCRWQASPYASFYA
jgi:hypothetical protein